MTKGKEHKFAYFYQAKVSYRYDFEMLETIYMQGVYETNTRMSSEIFESLIKKISGSLPKKVFDIDVKFLGLNLV